MIGSREVACQATAEQRPGADAAVLEDLGDRTKLTQTMRFVTTEERDTTMEYGVEEGAKVGFASVDALLHRLVETR